MLTNMNRLIAGFASVMALALALPGAATTPITVLNDGITYTGIASTPPGGLPILTSATLTQNTLTGAQFGGRYEGLVDGTDRMGLEAASVFTFLSRSGDGRTWNFNVQLSNLSGSPFSSAAVMGFGFGVSAVSPTTGNAVYLSGTSVSQAGSSPLNFGQRLFTTGASRGNVNQLGRIADACFMWGSSGTTSNCTGGGSGGLMIGAPVSDQNIAITFSQSVTEITLLNMFVRYQRLDAPSLRINGGSGSGLGTIVPGGDLDPSGDPVPEPASWAMLIAGFGLTGAAMRRRRRALAA
jgi:hypothetical protein